MTSQVTIDPSKVLSASAAFVVDEARISRAGGDILAPLVFAAIVQANIRPLSHSPDRARIDAAGEALPDEQRRPISMKAVAESLRLPYETVRRRTQALAQAGLCVLTPDGAYVPQAAIVSEPHAAIQRARLERLQAFHDLLAARGLLGAQETLPGPLPASLMRPVNTALSEYMLRTAERVAVLAGEVLRGLVLLALLADPAEGEAAVASGAERRPCSSLRLAGRLGMAREKVRRRVLELEGLGFVRRQRGGWVALTPARGPLPEFAAANDADLRRMFARLRELEGAVA